MKDKPISELVIRHVLTVSDEEFAALSVSKLAQTFEVDRYKLSREFKGQTDMKLEDFLFREKMTRAALMLLAYRDINIKEVAERIGFCTCDYFIRVFKHFYGVVPGKFRGYKTPRSGGDRRSGLKDRRQKVQKSKIPEAGDRRVGPKDRRNGRTDRRKQNNNHNGDSNQNSVEAKIPGTKGENGNS